MQSNVGEAYTLEQRVNKEFHAYKDLTLAGSTPITTMKE